jgi:hypothetical protein
LVAQVRPVNLQTIEYGGLNQAMLIAQIVQDITMNLSEYGASLAQQYILQEGVKVFGGKGHNALMKEIDQATPQENMFCSIEGKGNETF